MIQRLIKQVTGGGGSAGKRGRSGGRGARGGSGRRGTSGGGGMGAKIGSKVESMIRGRR